MQFRKLAAALACALVLALPGVALAQDNSTQAPVIDGLSFGDNQLTIFGTSLVADGEFTTNITVTVDNHSGPTSTTNIFPGSSALIDSFTETEVVFRPGAIPSVFDGSVKLTSSRGDSNLYEFTLNDATCSQDAIKVAALIGGDFDNWTATPSNWLFTSPEPTNLLMPYVGTLVTPGTQGEPGDFVLVTTAVYDCTDLLADQLALN